MAWPNQRKGKCHVKSTLFPQPPLKQKSMITIIRASSCGVCDLRFRQTGSCDLSFLSFFFRFSSFMRLFTISRAVK